MFRRLHPAWLAVGGSIVLLAVLLLVLNWSTGSSESEAPLYVYAGEALRLPLEAIQRDFEQEFGRKVNLHFGPSQTILASLELSKKGDLFLPADDSYVAMARDKKLLGEVLPVATMQAVVIVRPGFPRKIATWSDFTAPENIIGIAQPDAAAISKLARAHLQKSGRWQDLTRTQLKEQINVNDVVNAARLGTIDAGIVWDVVARPHTELTQVRLPELAGVEARVQVALTRCSTQPGEALRLAHYLRARDKGARHFKERGYGSVEEVEQSPSPDPVTLVVYAGAMLRPAIEQTLTEFEKTEKVRVTRVYNGCGILVSQMLAGVRPDLYFACDPRFVPPVEHYFLSPAVVSSNQLMITVPKGNPRGLKTLGDLAKKDLRVGVGHEQQCALGAITKETFLRTGVYAAVVKNVKVQSPTGDLLINQLRTGSLDVVVAYRSNVVPFDDIEGVPVTGIDCAAPLQPVAVAKDTAHPQLTRRLLEILQGPESRRRFENAGFRWELKP
jgi:molybdate transport system substrate-binding protein